MTDYKFCKIMKVFDKQRLVGIFVVYKRNSSEPYRFSVFDAEPSFLTLFKKFSRRAYVHAGDISLAITSSLVFSDYQFSFVF